MKQTQPSKLITCILPKGKGMPVLKQLKHEFGIITANVNYARGSGRLTPLTHRGVGEQTEKEIVTIMLNEEQAEEVFNFIFFNAEINRPHGGMIFQSTLTLATHYELPKQIADEE